MYLKQLYRHNKLLFLVIILFALAQIINNIRQDIAISPIYSYGMYSSKIKASDFYSVPEFFVDGVQLQTKDFSPQQWDNISQPVAKFYAQQYWNQNVWQKDIQRLLPFADSSKFVNNISEQDFRTWYKRHLESVFNREIDSVDILFTGYHFNGKSFSKAFN